MTGRFPIAASILALTCAVSCCAVGSRPNLYRPIDSTTNVRYSSANIYAMSVDAMYMNALSVEHVMEAPELFERMTPAHMAWLLPKLHLEDMRPCPVLEADVQQVLLVIELKAHDGAASDIYFSDGTYLFDRSKGSCHRVPPDFVRSFDPTQDM